MSLRGIAVSVLLVVGVGATLVSCVGVLAMRNAYDRLHYTAPATSNAVRVLGLALVGPVVLFGIYVVAHGHLTPGGGFQGGVVLATGAPLVYLSGEYVTLRRVRPEALIDLAESAGAASYVAIGFLGLAAGGTFLTNVLPLGQPGALLLGHDPAHQPGRRP
jgi:multicomponent Na+:H+ antiporter subunit B